MYISVGGALATIGLNVWLIPTIGFMGAAWTTLIAYGSMAGVSYVLGRRYYPILIMWGDCYLLYPFLLQWAGFTYSKLPTYGWAR